MSLFQNNRTGQLVELVSYHDKDYAMVKNQAGVVSYVALADLVGYEPGKGRTGGAVQSPVAKGESDPEAPPAPAIPPDPRLNLNTASAEVIAERIKGVGYATAKRIVELRGSLPGERFVNLDQVRSVGRVDWDAVFQDDVLYVA